MTTQAIVIGEAASVDVNAGTSADVDAAVAAAVGLRLVGFNARESAGSAAVATFSIVHGATVSGGANVATVELAANGSVTEWFWPGIAMASGISIDRVAGTFDLHLYYVTVV